jgi:glycosyltransferase involved in cell wall biosynthesis
MNPVAVSVLVPVFNTERYLRQCLDSILGQSLRDIEVVCVDDCSSDGSAGLVKRYAEKDARVRLIRQESNRGLGAARNRALAASRGEYIACVDSDDWLLPEALAVAHREAKDRALEVVCFKHVCYLEDRNSYAIEHAFKKFLDFPDGEIAVDESAIWMVTPLSWNKLFRAAFLRDNAVRWPEGIVYEDSAFHFKLFSLVERSYVIDRFFYVYRRRADSIMGQTFAGWPRIKEICAAGKDVYSYTTARGTFERIRAPFHQMLGSDIERYLRFSEAKNGLIIEAQKMLGETGYPATYLDSPKWDLFQAIHEYKPGTPLSEGVANALLFLVGLVPFKKLRRKWRSRVKLRSAGGSTPIQERFEPLGNAMRLNGIPLPPSEK